MARRTFKTGMWSFLKDGLSEEGLPEEFAPRKEIEQEDVSDTLNRTKPILLFIHSTATSLPRHLSTILLMAIVTLSASSGYCLARVKMP